MVTNLGHPAFAARGVGRTLEFYVRLSIGGAFRLHHDDGSLKLVYLHVSGDRFIEVSPRPAAGPEPHAELHARLPPCRRPASNRRAPAPERRADRPRTGSRPRRQPPGVNLGPRRQRDRAHASLGRLAAATGRPLLRPKRRLEGAARHARAARFPKARSTPGGGRRPEPRPRRNEACLRRPRAGVRRVRTQGVLRGKAGPSLSAGERSATGGPGTRRAG